MQEVLLVRPEAWFVVCLHSPDSLIRSAVSTICISYTSDGLYVLCVGSYDREGVLLAYVFFLPCYRDHKLAGYCANILRQAPGSKPGYALDYLICEAIELFRKEGLDYVSLAPAVLYNLEKTDNESPTFRRLCE